MADDQTDATPDGDGDGDTPAPAPKTRKAPASIKAEIVMKPDGSCSVKVGGKEVPAGHNLTTAYTAAKVAHFAQATEHGYELRV